MFLTRQTNYIRVYQKTEEVHSEIVIGKRKVEKEIMRRKLLDQIIQNSNRSRSSACHSSFQLLIRVTVTETSLSINTLVISMIIIIIIY